MAFARHTAPRLGKPSFPRAKTAAPQPLGGGGLMIQNALNPAKNLLLNSLKLGLIFQPSCELAIRSNASYQLPPKDCSCRRKISATDHLAPADVRSAQLTRLKYNPTILTDPIQVEFPIVDTAIPQTGSRLLHTRYQPIAVQAANKI
jgi:hypothetical protein